MADRLNLTDFRYKHPQARCAVALTLLVMMLAIDGLALAAVARGPNYRYGEAWWREYEADDKTALLLHFGEPAPPAWKSAGEKAQEKREQQKQATDLMDLNDVNALTGDASPVDRMSVDELSDEAMRGQVKEVAGTVADYSHHRLRDDLPRNASIVEQGRFGQALRLAAPGSPGLSFPAQYGKGESMECWFKVDQLPDQSVCILSAGSDEGRVLLHPDGTIELKLRRSHGYPSDRHNTPEQLEAVRSQDATIRSNAPVTPGQWHHVLAWNDWPVVQGMGQPFNARLWVDGMPAANYLSEPNNSYNFMGRGGQGPSQFTVGNSAQGDQPFVGLIDEVRVSDGVRTFYRRPPIPWRDETASRPVQFGKPYFLADSEVFHASLNGDARYDMDKAGSDGITLPPGLTSAESLATQGIRGGGWVVDPLAGFPRFDLKGMNALDGALEFWLRPVNWDDITGYWSHSPPHNRGLSVVRFYGRDKRDGQVKLFMNAELPRAHNIERGRADIDPGHWHHWVVTWSDGDLQRAFLHQNGKWFSRIHRADPELLQNIEPLYAEFGVNEDVTVANQGRPLIVVDEVVGYQREPSKDEIRQAMKRWQGELQPIEFFEANFQYKYSIAKLEFSLLPKLPPGQTPATITVQLERADDGSVVAGPVKASMSAGEKVRLVVSDGQPIPYGDYRLAFVVRDADGQVLIADHKVWRFDKAPWRDSQAGIIDQPASPWTPIRREGNELHTLMTTWRVGEHGLPDAIIADGENLLVGPVQLLEAGQPMQGKPATFGDASAIEANWSTTLSGQTCDVQVSCRLEFDGMVRYELTILPKADKVAPLAFVVPMKSKHVSHLMWNEAGKTGVRTLDLKPQQQGEIFSSRRPAFWYAEYQARKKKQDVPQWESYRDWAFMTQIDLNDLHRGLYWFADHAGGWWQSKAVDTQVVERDGDVTRLVCNLIAEPVAYESDQPIVFGMLPHPARPMDDNYRIIDRASPEEEPLLCDVFGSVFKPFPMSPRGEGNMMKLFPAADPDNPEAGPSWEYAESCIPHMKATQPVGARTMYLSNYWFSCRAGAYDGWEWRGGPTGQVTHSQSMVDYLCWEMNEWIGRGIYDGIYLDECYEAPSKNVEAGQAIVLPDGTVQAGVTLWGYREMMKRWRNIFIAHDKKPLFLIHHTRSMMYAGSVFCDVFLDGEGHPTITAHSKDFVDSLSRDRAEVLQNGPLWGLTPFFMPSIWEGGLGQGKGFNPHTRWSWRMARGAMSLLAHFENGIVYADQGNSVYRNYWQDVLKWGAGDTDIPFRPYYANSRWLDVDAPHSEAMVSFYQKPDGLLLIVSNRANEQREVRIKLDRQALGMTGQLSVQPWDTGFKPDPGEDLLDDKQMAQETSKAATLDLEAGGAEADLFGAIDDIAAGKDETQMREKLTPRLEGDVLVVPVRARDFRLIRID